jgi:hypothetical protein
MYNTNLANIQPYVAPPCEDVALIHKALALVIPWILREYGGRDCALYAKSVLLCFDAVCLLFFVQRCAHTKQL